MMPDYNKIDLSNVKFDGDPFNVTEGVIPEEHPEPTFDPTALPTSTNTPTDADEIIIGESSKWVRKSLAKIWDYIKGKIPVFQGATNIDDGVAGYVPVAHPSDINKFLKGNGQWSPINMSYVGMIIHSTTLNTEAKVKSFYGGTTWIQHSGYFLRGASSDVTANSAVKDGGQDTVTPSGTNSDGAVKSHTLTVNEMPSHNHNLYYNSIGQRGGGNWMMTNKTGSTGYTDTGCEYKGGGQGHSHGFTQPTFTGNSHTNVPSYKNVYIWERTA